MKFLYRAVVAKYVFYWVVDTQPTLDILTEISCVSGLLGHVECQQYGMNAEYRDSLMLAYCLPICPTFLETCAYLQKLSELGIPPWLRTLVGLVGGMFGMKESAMLVYNFSFRFLGIHRDTGRFTGLV